MWGWVLLLLTGAHKGTVQQLHGCMISEPGEVKNYSWKDPDESLEISYFDGSDLEHALP
ncbi:MAG: hypothetical protein AMXMBFR67_35080 [Nitrospira sp.]